MDRSSVAVTALTSACLAAQYSQQPARSSQSLPLQSLNFWLCKGCKQCACMHAFVWKNEVCVCVHKVGHLCLHDWMRGQGREVRGFPRVVQIVWDKEPHAVMWLLQLKVVGLNLGARRLFIPIGGRRCHVPESHPVRPCVTQEQPLGAALLKALRSTGTLTPPPPPSPSPSCTQWAPLHSRHVCPLAFWNLH